MSQARQSKLHQNDIIKAQLEAEYDEEEYFNNIMKNAQKNVSQLFFQSGLTLTQFALQVGISHSSLARIIDGRKNISLQTLCKIGSSLNVPIEKIIASQISIRKNKKKNTDINSYTILNIENPRAEGSK